MFKNYVLIFCSLKCCNLHAQVLSRAQRRKIVEPYYCSLFLLKTWLARSAKDALYTFFSYVYNVMYFLMNMKKAP